MYSEVVFVDDHTVPNIVGITFLISTLFSVTRRSRIDSGHLLTDLLSQR